MEIRDLRFICLTAEMQHVTKAAERLGVAQPYLTKIIKQVEDEIGGELFNASGRGIQLNEYGEIFYKYAKRTLSDMDRLYSEMDYFFNRKDHTITLLSNTEAFSSKLIIEFQKINPNYSLKILQASNQEMFDALVRCDADFALCCPPLAEDECFGVTTEEVFYEVGCALLPPGHELIGSGTIDLDDLRGEPLITMPPKSGMRYKLDPVFDKYDFHPQIVLETNSINTAIKAVNSGWGYAFLTTLILDDYPELKDRCVQIDIPEIKGSFGLSYNKLALSKRSAYDFRIFMRQFLKDLKSHLYGL